MLKCQKCTEETGISYLGRLRARSYKYMTLDLGGRFGGYQEVRGEVGESDL